MGFFGGALLTLATLAVALRVDAVFKRTRRSFSVSAKDAPRRSVRLAPLLAKKKIEAYKAKLRRTLKIITPHATKKRTPKFDKIADGHWDNEIADGQNTPAEPKRKNLWRLLREILKPEFNGTVRIMDQHVLEMVGCKCQRTGSDPATGLVEVWCRCTVEPRGFGVSPNWFGRWEDPDAHRLRD
jgi:hypothetical protein